MTIKEISKTHSRVEPDEGKMLYFGDDATEYSVIVCKTKVVGKIVEK